MKLSRRQLRKLINEVFRDDKAERNIRRAQAGIDAPTMRTIKHIEKFQPAQGISLAQSLGSKESEPHLRYNMSRGVPLQIYKSFIMHELNQSYNQSDYYQPIAHKTLEHTLREMWPLFGETRHHPFEEIKFFAALDFLIKSKEISKTQGSGKITYNDDGTYDVDREGTYYVSNY